MGTLKEAVDAHPKVDAETLAAKIIKDLSEAELVRLVADEIVHLRRQQTRAIEAEAFRSMRPGFKAGRKPATFDREGFRSLFGGTFRLGDTVEVAWERATVEQHQQRVAMLVKMRDGLNESIALHESVISALKAAGASCLAELDEGKAAA